MKIIAKTQKGLDKTENEDRIVIGKTVLSEGRFSGEINSGIIAIADGVGGQNAGAAASQFVSDRICKLNEISDETFRNINDELISVSESSEQQKGMATTLSGLFYSDRGAQLFSIGNTRVYVLQGKKYLKQLTTDDTTLNYLLATGQLSLLDAETFDRKNEITACFGGGTTSLFRIKIQQFDSLTAPIMITSDGIHDYVSIDQLEDIIAEYGMSEYACDVMIKTARENGSFDDASVIFGGN